MVLQYSRRPEFEADDAIDFVETMAGRDDNRTSEWERISQRINSEDLRPGSRVNGTVDQRSSAIDAGRLASRRAAVDANLI